jgi:hypothetical protein
MIKTKLCSVCLSDGLRTPLINGCCWKHGKDDYNVIKKYYVGAKHIGQAIHDGRNSDCTRATLDDAILEAKNMIENGEVNCAIVVQIVRIVRRTQPPITVEEV